MSLPVRSCLCRRHSERFEGPRGSRQWLRLLRRSTCSKRGSVRTVFVFPLPFRSSSVRNAPKTKGSFIQPQITQVHVRRSFETSHSVDQHGLRNVPSKLSGGAFTVRRFSILPKTDCSIKNNIP